MNRWPRWWVVGSFLLGALGIAILVVVHTLAPTPPIRAGSPPDASARRLGSPSWDGWDFALAQGDANVRWSRTIYDSTGNPVDITGATVAFRYRLMNQSAPAVTNAGAVTGPVGNLVASYTFTGTDTATAGDYNASFIVTLPIPDGGIDGSQETITYPSNRFLRFTVTPAP